MSCPTRQRLAPHLHTSRAAAPPRQGHTTSCEGSNTLLIPQRKRSQLRVPRNELPVTQGGCGGTGDKRVISRSILLDAFPHFKAYHPGFVNAYTSAENTEDFSLLSPDPSLTPLALICPTKLNAGIEIEGQNVIMLSRELKIAYMKILL